MNTTTRTVTRTDPATGRTFELDASVEQSGWGIPAPHPEHHSTSIAIDAARDLDTGKAIDPEDLPESVLAWFERLTPADL